MSWSPPVWYTIFWGIAALVFLGVQLAQVWLLVQILKAVNHG